MKLWHVLREQKAHVPRGVGSDVLADKTGPTCYIWTNSVKSVCTPRPLHRAKYKRFNNRWIVNIDLSALQMACSCSYAVIVPRQEFWKSVLHFKKVLKTFVTISQCGRRLFWHLVVAQSYLTRSVPSCSTSTRLVLLLPGFMCFENFPEYVTHIFCHLQTSLVAAVMCQETILRCKHCFKELARAISWCGFGDCKGVDTVVCTSGDCDQCSKQDEEQVN